MKQRTVNGISIQEVWKMLQAEFPEADIRRHPTTNKRYIPVEKIEIEPYIQAVPQIGVAILPKVGLHWGVAANAGIRFHF